MKVCCAALLTGKNMNSSHGNQAKFQAKGCWYKADYLGYEGAAEYICSELLRHSNVPLSTAPWVKKYDFVEYRLCGVLIGDEIYSGCKSADFLKQGDAIVTIADLLDEEFDITPEYFLKGISVKDKIQKIVNFVEDVTGLSNVGEYLTQLLEFDRLVLNEDRHFNNIAFIRHPDGTFDFCPIFDNGAAFLSDIQNSYPLGHDTVGLMSNVKAKPFSEDFDTQVDACVELYGKQLVMHSFEVSPEALEKVAEMYGPTIAQRFDTIIKRQAYLYSEYIVSNDFHYSR